MPTITTQISNTGGAIIINLGLSPTLDPNTSNITLTRQTNDGPSVTLYSSVYCPVYVDAGDLLPNHLDFATSYTYTVTDDGGTATTAGIVPAASILVTSSYIDGLMFRLFTAGIHALDVPAGVTKGNEIRVLQALPFSRGEILPCIVMNLDLLQQEDVGIGRAVDPSFTNTWTIPSWSLRRYSFWVLTRTPQDRDFYKDACISVLMSIMTDVMNTLGQNYRYSFQAAQSQIVDPSPELAPGFYESNVLLELTGTVNFAIKTNFGTIESISPIVSATTESPSGGIITEIIIG